MRIVVVFVALIGAAEVRASCDEIAPSCTTLTACVEQFHALAPRSYDNGGLDEAMRGLSAGFVQLAPTSIPTLITLLDDADVRHRNVVADALGTLKARAAVPALLRHLDDTSWASWALGRIGDERALPALLKELARPMSNGDAIVRFGRAGVTALAVALVDPRASDVVRQNATNALTDADNDVDVSEAVDVLRRALPAADERIDQILMVLKSFGERAAVAIPDVHAVRARVADREGITRTSLSTGTMSSFTTMPRINDVLLALGDDSVVVDVAARFGEDPIRTHMDLATLGPRAAAAIPLFVDALEHGSWSLQADAAHGLGFFGDATAAPALVVALSSNSWVVVNEAARALGRIGVDVGPHVAERLAVLRDVHWSAAVRDTADIALRRVMGERIGELNDAHDGVHQVVADHRAEGGEVHGFGCDVEGNLATMTEPPHRFVFVADEWLDVSNQETPMFDGIDPRIATLRLPPLQVPARVDSMPVDDGTLVGRDAGEWGGDLHFIDRRARVTKLHDGNVIQLRAIDGVVFAFTGLAHMGGNDGAVLRIEKHEGRWRAVPFVALPGAPYAIRRVPGRAAFVVVDDLNAAVVDVDGTIETVPCRIAAPTP